ncbi:uncharacterized protein [Prorops nasuta]|uniref:uncharacterized protein isoform X2 n=1 Tax=Prorops nasuta TaxID=863751 RepID=UPI0034CD5917
MDYDSESSCEDRLKDLESSEQPLSLRQAQKPDKLSQVCSSIPWHSTPVTHAQSKLKVHATCESLSSQVMEYLQKYSRNSNLDQYLSLPTSSTSAEEADSSERKTSPTSSIASHKPLEWDSGADVGYFNTLPHNKQNSKQLSTIERMALSRGCSAALRLDPEGTTESCTTSKASAEKLAQAKSKISLNPDANSTPILENISGSESEIEITPIVKIPLSGIITGNDIKSNENCICKENNKMQEELNQSSQNNNSNNKISETPKSSFTIKIPITKYPTEGRRIVHKNNGASDNLNPFNSPLKKSTSMNVIPAFSKLSLKRSQSELNLHIKDRNKVLAPYIFNSTSSISTIVNKPSTCDKVIQTSINTCQESIGVQVSVTEEERPPLPKRGTSLQKTLHSILKNPKGTYKVQNTKKHVPSPDLSKVSGKEESLYNRKHHTSPEISQHDSSNTTPQPDDLENITGRANSFEYFPGHVYENVPNGNSSHVSSVDTGRSNSTVPNTSSSIDEKLWGDSDSLVRDLERSVNILRSLVDANKCDKHVKKRLIHHVVKRLVTAKYTDDKIEHNLEDNVPWNPDDARNKVYRTEILQALTEKHSTTDSSDDWKPRKQKDCTKKPVQNDRNRERMVEVVLDSSNSDKFDRHTDRTEMDGRKARMGLRTDDCQHNIHSPTDVEKSESSECFFPQRSHKTSKAKNIFCLKDKCKLPHEESTTTNSSPPDANRILLNAIVSNRRTPNQRNSDWRLPTTLSERQFVLKQCSNSESGDSKLVNYAEMEKRNQLLWITNEISHLCNLKKLLEQPRKLEKVKSSPRKLKPMNFKHKPLTIVPCTKEQIGNLHYIQCSVTPEMPEHQMNGQWSSHCNLAACPLSSNGNPKLLKYMRKRNSFSQTATDAMRAHSKTGCEIVSAARTGDGLNEITHAATQTNSDNISNFSSIQTKSDARHYVACPAHKKCSHYNSNYECQCILHGSECPQNMSIRCPTYKSHLQQDSCKCFVSTVDAQVFNKNKQTISQMMPLSAESMVGTVDSSGATSNQFKQKETKNQINASKSKFICGCDGVRTCHCKEGIFSESNSAGFNKKEYRKQSSNVCQQYSQETPVIENSITCQNNQCQNPMSKCANMFVCLNKNEDHLVYCTCPNTTGINENENASKSERKSTIIKLNGKSNKNGFVSKNTAHTETIAVGGCSEKCSCENNHEKNMCAIKQVCECCMDSKQYCNGESHAMQESLAKQRTYYLSNEKEMKHSQCSKLQNDVTCNCGNNCMCINRAMDDERKLYDTHYGTRTSCNAMNFNKVEKGCKCCHACGTVYQTTRNCKCYHLIPKPIAYELSFTKEDPQKTDDATHINVTPKAEACVCDKAKINHVNKKAGNTNTLQDYLTKNKPDFVDNAETRRQYMYEISHLRELRKEKRVQLLAMASIPNVSKPARSYKFPGYTQRKLTEREMKERLRKRYLRLNEVNSKRRQRERQEEARRNKLMAKIFCKKLQQKVLRGQVDLSQSISVISNL